MKKKVFLTLLSVICVLACLLGLAACNKPSSQKSEEFIRVTDGVFGAAGYVKSVSNSSKGQSVTAKDNSAVFASVLLSADARSQSEITKKLRELSSEIASDDNTNGLDDYNLNYLKGDALYQGANLAGLFRALAAVLGDNAFDTVYSLTNAEGTNFLKLESGDCYTLRGVTKSNGIISSVHINFAEYEQDKFVFKLAQYSKMNDRSELRFAYFDSESATFIAELYGDIGFDFTNYDENYNAFEVAECTVVIFDDENYVSDKTPNNETDEKVLKFVKDNLGFDNQTYKTLANISGGKEISNKDALQIDSEMSKNRYINPYIGTHSNVTPKNEYTIPSDVTVVDRLSIPATKKLIVPTHVEKILDAPFLYPQFVEEIVFEDPDNGALVQIGDDDIVENGFDPFNTSRYFFLSFTKVKNFTLPKTVKKIAGVIYVTTDMNVLDLSAYHPDYEMGEFYQKQYGYTVKLSTSAFNQLNKYKELGSIDKLYINGDFSIVYEDIDVNIGGNNGYVKVDPEYAYHINENKFVAYSPSQDIFDMLAALNDSGNFTSPEEVYSYLNWHKTDYLVNELIATGVNEHMDLQSDLFASVSLTVDVGDFGTVYDVIKDAQTDNISFTIMENGKKKTSINLYDCDGSDLSASEKAWVKTPDGEKMISNLTRKETFYAPSATATKTTGNETLYFVGWSFSHDAAAVDFYEGDEVVNYYQNMYPVYMPATENGVTYTEEDGEVTAIVNGTYENGGVIVIRNEYNGKSVRYVSLGSYRCEKIIIPDTVNGANSNILNALDNGHINDLKNIWKISNTEEIKFTLGNNSSLRERLKTCAAVYYEQGLYYLKNNVSNYWMLFAADQDLTGQVFIPNDCYILAVEFGSKVTEIVLPSDTRNSKLQYISYLKFDSLNNFTICGNVKQIEYVSGKVNNRFSLALNSNQPANIISYALSDLQVSEVFIDVNVLTKDTVELLVRPNEIFNKNINLYLSCEYDDIQNYSFGNIGANVYFFSQSEPDFNDYDIGSYNYWHYDNSMNFAVWERPE